MRTGGNTSGPSASGSSGRLQYPEETLGGSVQIGGSQKNGRVPRIAVSISAGTPATVQKIEKKSGTEPEWAGPCGAAVQPQRHSRRGALWEERWDENQGCEPPVK